MSLRRKNLVRFPGTGPAEVIVATQPSLTASEKAFCEQIFAAYLTGKGDPELASALRAALEKSAAPKLGPNAED